MKQQTFGIAGGTVTVRCSDRSDGSFALDEATEALELRRRTLLGPGRRWVGLRQVHGNVVLDADVESAGALPEADGSVACVASVGLAVLSADCAPVVLVGSTGVAVVHAGWRGAAAGVIEAAAAQLRSRGAEPVATLLGPCIQPSAYEFGAADLDPIVASFGPEIIGHTATGADALDLTRVVQISCERAGWLIPDRPACTSHPDFYSHRTRADKERQATIAWIDWETR